MKIGNCNLIKIAYNCLIARFFAINDGWFSYFQHLYYCKRFFFAPSWLEKEEQLGWLGKKLTPVRKILMVKNMYFVVFTFSKVVLWWFNNLFFKKNMSWAALHRCTINAYFFIRYAFPLENLGGIMTLQDLQLRASDETIFTYSTSFYVNRNQM